MEGLGLAVDLIRAAQIAALGALEVLVGRPQLVPTGSDDEERTGEQHEADASDRAPPTGVALSAMARALAATGDLVSQPEQGFFIRRPAGSL